MAQALWSESAGDNDAARGGLKKCVQGWIQILVP